MSDLPERTLLSVSEIIAITHGIALNSPGKSRVQHVCIDSREVRKGSLFIALPGERTDGHRFIAAAAASGASCILIDRDQSTAAKAALAGKESCVLVAVADTYAALRALAAEWVSRFPGLVRIAVTGSSGKTTTKEMTSAILSELGPTVKNPGNYNSDIGLPLSVFSIDRTHEFGVFEMGISHVGEMQRMLEVYTPDIGLMTNIGTAHIGMMGSQEAIAREKSRIFGAQTAHGYMIEHSPWTPYIEQLRGTTLEPFGHESTRGFTGATSLGLQGWKISYDGIEIHLKHIGSHNLINALGAITLAQGLGATRDHIQAGLESLQPMHGRSRVINGAVTVIEDCYNSNVESAGRILDYVKELDWSGRKTVVLGSLKELGFAAERAHKIIGRRVAGLGPNGAFLYGKEMKAAYDQLRKEQYGNTLFYTDSYEELEHTVTSYVHQGDLVLVKGSRAMAMERLIDPLSHVS